MMRKRLLKQFLPSEKTNSNRIYKVKLPSVKNIKKKKKKKIPNKA